ncbi:MAG: hypothetical protein ABIS50_19340 [Luteolibacter sp.]|uniref:hypothetical protein n=1 Tax=Luteolibacter sp. TaxID=1962973 RepID=UPI0032643602
MKRLLLLTFLFCPLLACPLQAAAKEKAPKRVCRILFLNPPADAPEKLFLFDGAKSREVQLSGMNLSETQEIPAGDADLYLTPALVAKPGEIPSGAPTAKLPASFGDFYLVVTSDPANTVAPVKIQILDSGKQKFKKGQILWYNLTSSKIIGDLGTKKLDLGGNAQAVVEEPAKENESFDVNLSYLAPDDPTPHPLTQTQWVHDPRSRMVMLVYADGENAVPQLTGVKDFRETK